MAIKVFPAICPDNEIQGEFVPTVGVLQFGDGYMHRQVDGINAHRRTWTLTFENIYENEYNMLVKFIEGTKGAEAFLYKFIYEDDTRMVIAPEGYTHTQKSGGFFDLSVMIQEVNDAKDLSQPVEIVYPYLDMVIGSDMNVRVTYSGGGDLTGAVVTVSEAFPAQLKNAVVVVEQPPTAGQCTIQFKAAQTQHLLQGQLNWFRLKAVYATQGVTDVTPKIGINGK